MRVHSANYIIITPPSPYHQIQHKLFSGADLVVRYFYHGTIYAFQINSFPRLTCRCGFFLFITRNSMSLT